MKTNTLLRVLSGLAIVVAAQTASALPPYTNAVPNGAVFSCSTCHVPAGPPGLNPFGQAFMAANTTWGPDLAALDSDGDGFSNGAELGDPDGNGVPEPAAEVTNPGDPDSHPAPASPPTITTQPASQSVTAGASVALSVVATGAGTLTYQWQRDGANIDGATGDTLMLNNVTAADAGAYRVIVTGSGGSVTSDDATIEVTPIALSVTLTSPADGASFTEPASFALTAALAPADASVSQVEFFQGSTSLGTLTAPPFTFDVANLGAGTYTYTARVTTSAGDTATSPGVTVTVTGTPPPPGPATVTVVATDPDASEVGPDPGTFRVSRTGAMDAPLTVHYLLSGTAVNGQDYQMLPDSVTIPAGMADADITVMPILDTDTDSELSDAVVLQLTGAPTGEPGYTIGSPSNAVVTIAEATTGGGGSNQPPVVSLVHPRNGFHSQTGHNIPLVAMASDPDGSITQVQFFAGTMLLGAGSLVGGSDPAESEDGQLAQMVYVFHWRDVPVGEYDITAVATDNSGASTTSAPVHITVGRRMGRGHH